MAKTSISSASAYASASDLLNFHDEGAVGDYAKDGQQLNRAQILTSAVVSATLLRASGEVEAACLKGGRYTPSDLAALTGAGQSFLKGLVCDLAFYHLAKRRGRPDTAKSVPGYQEAIKTLEALGNGEMVFGFQETADAGLMEKIDLSQDSTGILQRPTDQMRRRFGTRLDNLGSNPITGQR